jgi:hypothetical protein
MVSVVMLQFYYQTRVNLLCARGKGLSGIDGAGDLSEYSCVPVRVRSADVSTPITRGATSNNSLFMAAPERPDYQFL